MGQEIARLIEGSLKSGNYKLNFDAGKMASGVYLYRLQGGDVNITKKMILQK